MRQFAWQERTSAESIARKSWILAGISQMCIVMMLFPGLSWAGTELSPELIGSQLSQGFLHMLLMPTVLFV